MRKKQRHTSLAKELISYGFIALSDEKLSKAQFRFFFQNASYFWKILDFNKIKQSINPSVADNDNQCCVNYWQICHLKKIGA